LAANSKRKLLLNLADLSQVDSSVSVIIEAYVSLERQGGELKLLSPRGRVFEVLPLFRLLDVIPSFGDETQASDREVTQQRSEKRYLPTSDTL